MNRSDFAFKPHSDMSADKKDIVIRHNDKIRKKQYRASTALLETNHYQDGFRASLFNCIQNKIRSLQIYLLNEFNAEPDELYSLSEPTAEQMKGKNFWIQPYDD